MAENADDLSLRIARAKALRARRRLEEGKEQIIGGEPTMGDRAQGFIDTSVDVVNEFNRGMMGLLPTPLRRPLENVGVGVETEFSGTSAGRGVRTLGGSAPLVFGGVAAGQTGAQLMNQRGILQTMLDDIAQTATKYPKTFFSAEAGASLGAGAASQAAIDSDAGPGTQLAAEVAGAFAGGGPPAMASRSARALRDSVQANLLPMTEQGGMVRAARQVQERAGGPETAAQAAETLATIPDGVTPAQWIGNERLMAQEARILQDNPQLENFVRSELNEARLIAQEELQDTFGRPRSREDWEINVLERVTPEGTMIEPGLSDEMLQQAYESFAPLYAEARGYPVDAVGFQSNLVNAPNDPNVIATDAERRAVSNWVRSQLTAFDDRFVNNQTNSDTLLDLRQRVRDERRQQTSRGREERADLLGTVESALTERLQNALPQDAINTLNAADSQYRKYKVVESAIFNAGDESFTARDLSDAIQRGGLTTSSRYARGQDPATQDLRRIALGGRSTEEVLGDPRRAAQIVRDMSPAERQAVHADFVQTLFNKSMSAEATQSGIPFVSGDKLTVLLNDNIEVMKNLGMEHFDTLRLKRIANEIKTMGKKTPEAVQNLFDDGPASILQLGAALMGAKSGQRVAGQGLGSSLVLAQYMSNKARSTLANLTSNEAERLLIEATTDPELYKALLTKEVTSPDAARRQARYLESWLLSSAYDRARETQQQPNSRARQ